MKFFEVLAAAGIITFTATIGSTCALASNMKEGYVNGVTIYYLKDGDGPDVDFIAVTDAPAGEHRLIVNCQAGQILGSKGNNSKEWEQATAVSYCDKYR